MSFIPEDWLIPALVFGTAVLLILLLRRWSQLSPDDPSTATQPASSSYSFPKTRSATSEIAVILTTPNPLEAALVQELLDANGIPTSLIDQYGQVRSAFRFDMSEYRVAIPSAALAKAQRLLEEYEVRSGEPTDEKL